VAGGELDVLTLGRGDRAAAADEDARGALCSRRGSRRESSRRRRDPIFCLSPMMLPFQRPCETVARMGSAAVDGNEIEGEGHGPLRSVRVARLTELTWPRITEPAGTSTRRAHSGGKPSSSRRSVLDV